MLIVTYRVKHLPDLEKTEYNAKYGDDPASRLFNCSTFQHVQLWSPDLYSLGKVEQLNLEMLKMLKS